MKNCISKFLEIQGYKVGPIQEINEHELVIRITKKKEHTLNNTLNNILTQLASKALESIIIIISILT
jgi:hypothetical protein